MAMRPSGHVPRLRGGRLTPMSEINVTPMVDVMLVLLVIFMITAPLLTVGLQIDLPETKSQTLPGQDEPVEVTVNAEGKIFVQETEVELQDIVPRLVAITENKRDTRLFVRGDRTINYGRVDAAGFRKVALVTKLPQGEQ
jgi:biopolymer transport protein TolR